jgi:hypothetical protein
MSDVFLPPIWWKGRSMEHIMENVNVLDANLPREEAHDTGCEPELHSTMEKDSIEYRT